MWSDCISSIATITPAISNIQSSARNMAIAMMNRVNAANALFDGTKNHLYPAAFMTDREGNETYTFREMLKQPDVSDFVQAMMKEANDHKERGHWEVVPIWEKPSDAKPIMAIWAFKRK